ncbi:uncharacterized protein Mid1 [Planococcus citri]|uniref:uncharacterized protein Mid1 n=1 Tax=Planococcus citri TaxID=170843 RepID=UPI0031F8F017
MPLGELFSCVWLVLLALYLMTTFPSCFHCSSYPTTTYLSSSSSSSSSSHSSSSPSQSSQPEQKSATAAISSHTSCHHQIITSEFISSDCQQVLQKQQEPRMRITGQISEGPGPPSCAAPCSDKQRSDSRKSFCHRYLNEKDCAEPWSMDWSSIRLRHCCEHSVREAVPNADESLKDPQQCERHVRDLLELDAFVAKVTCQFEQILLRYDCNQNYSVNSCQKCKDAYRRWVCASLIPHWKERHKIKPCRSICHEVEQTCPWFLPAEKTPGYPAQYAGEPIFQCIDENIPENGEQLLRSTYGSACCYEYCKKRRAGAMPPVGYHQENQQNSYEIGSCIVGCDDSSSNDPSHEPKNGLCQPPSSTSTTASNLPDKSSNSPTIPFVNFPLSSCPSSDSDSTSSNDATGLESSSATSKSAPFNLLILTLILYLYVTNVKIDDWR